MKRDTKAKILFAAGVGDLPEAVSIRLEGQNWELIRAVDAGEALEILNREKADLVLVDAALPDAGGIFQRLKQNRLQAESGLWFRQFMIDTGRHAVYRVNEGMPREEIALSPKEYDILIVMVKRPREVILYRELYHAVWEQEDLGDVRPLMVHVSNLRKKIDRDHKKVIRAVREVGYIFEDL